MSTHEPGVRSAGAGDKPCLATSPGGWHCCREEGHGAPHIGSTADWESLYMWGPRGGRWLPGPSEVYTYKDGRTIPIVPAGKDRS